MNQHVKMIKMLLIVSLSFLSFCAVAQNPTDSVPGDPGALSVYPMQNLSFGAFTIGSNGGTIVIASNGTRSVTGDIIPLNMGLIYCQAFFEVEAPEGSILSILNGPDVALAGSNGGSLSLKIGISDPISPFSISVPSPGRTSISIGGTLTVGSLLANPPGAYTGNFYITFNQE
jgi:uncharacterized protein DUF4402